MARDDVKREMRDALRVEPFFQGGSNRLVKVLPFGAGTPATVTGYVTQERFLLGLTPAEIEQALGLRVDSLQFGCRIFRLVRPPGPSEAVYEMTTKYPDGLAYTAMSNPAFPPSQKGFVHQWRLTTNIGVTKPRDLLPGVRYAAVP